jgi:glycosyltransferase involved in cell wall biosynthesis
MKIVWIVPDMTVSAHARAVCELSARLVDRGHEVEILYPSGRREVPLPAGVRGTACGLDLEPPLSSMILNAPALLVNVPPCDWIICLGPPSPLIGWAAGKLRNARVLVYATGDERVILDARAGLDSNVMLGLYRRLADLSHNLPLKYVANSSWTATRLRHGRGRNCPIIPGGVNPSIFREGGPLMVRDDLFTLIALGSPDPRKGLPDLVAALNRLAREGSERRFQLWVVARQEVDLSEAKFPHKVFGAATDGELTAAFRAADLLVYPSWAEGFGLPPLEAMACGLATVIADCGGVREYAQHNLNCHLIPPRDIAALARALAACMDDSALRSRLAQAGLETASRFTWRRSAALLETILDSKS